MGNVIKPGTSAGDLSGVYYTNADGPTAPTFRIVEVPEPSSLTLTACAATLLLRHRSRVGKASRRKT